MTIRPMSAAAVLLVLAASLAMAKTKREPCPAGRFVVQGEPILSGAAASPDAVVVGTTLSIASGCAPVAVKPKATKKGTRLKARWKSCTGITGKATFAGLIEPTCGTLTGTFRAKKAKLRRQLTATRGSCGDGLVDAGAGETCEGTCTGGTCSATTCTCTPDQAGNQPPTAAFTTSADTVAAGTALAFDATGSSDPDGDTLTYSWDFGDGGRGGVMQLAHVFAGAGSVEVVLTVADGRGGMATAQRTIVVTAGPTPVGTVVVDGVVRTTGGMPLGGVAVELQGGGASGITAGDGTVSLTIPRGVPVTLRLTRDGYADQVVVVQTPVVAESAIFQAEMTARAAAQPLDATSGGSLIGGDGAALTLPAGALALPDGTPAGGMVDVRLTPVDPTTDPDAFPGMFAGVTPTAQRGLLLSYGTVEFDFAQNGQRLDLAPGQKATIEIPFYGNAAKDGTPIAAGDTVPLWSLDEQTGTWMQEGVGTIVASATSPTGFALRAEVGHFSWWNSDLFDAPPYEPKPKCCVDTNYDGECEDLSNTGYCWHYGTGPEQGGPGTFGALVDPPRVPQYAAETMLPLGGGAVLPVPANYPITLRSSALAGTYVGTTTLDGPGGVQEDVTVFLYPAGGETTPITIPWDEIYPIAPTETDRYVFSATQGDPVYVRVSRSGSTVNGTVFVDGPGANDFGPTSFASGAANLGFLAPATGQYFVNVEGTSNTGNYRLEVKPTGSFPLLLSTSPADGAQGVALNATISATFTVDIDPTSVTDSSFKVEQAAVAVAGTRQVSGATITFTPSAPLGAGVPHVVTLGTGITAQGGTGLGAPQTFGFSTLDTVGALSPIHPGQRPALATLPGGEAMVIFDSDSASVRGTAVSRYVPGGGWSAPVFLRNAPNPLGQAIAANAAGQVIAVYRQRDAGVAQPNNVWASHWTSAGGWGSPVAIEGLSDDLGGFGNASGDFEGLGVAIDAAGNGIAIFSQSNQKLWWNRYTAGVGWGTADLVADVTTGTYAEPTVAMNAAGEAFIVWSQALSGINQVLARRFTPGGGLEPSEPIADVYGPVDVGIDDDGNAFVLFRKSGQWRVRRYDAGDAMWEAGDTPLQADGSGLSLATDNDARVIVRPNGHAMAGGHAFTSEHLVWAAAYTPDGMGGGTWAAADTLETIWPAGGAELSMNADGKALMVYAGVNGSDHVRWKAFRPGMGWDAMAGVLAPLDEQNLPHGAVAANGSSFATSIVHPPTSFFGATVVMVRLE